MDRFQCDDGLEMIGASDFLMVSEAECAGQRVKQVDPIVGQSNCFECPNNQNFDGTKAMIDEAS